MALAVAPRTYTSLGKGACHSKSMACIAIALFILTIAADAHVMQADEDGATATGVVEAIGVPLSIFAHEASTYPVKEVLTSHVATRRFLAASGCADQADARKQHNSYRASHRAPALVWDNALAAASLTWAKKLAAGGCSLQHDTSSGAGENLYALWSSGSFNLNCVPAVKSWYSEVKNYNFTKTPWTDNKGHFGAIGHFTQLVWKSSSKLGCAAARGNKCYVVVCRYSPPGNYITDKDFFNNVLPKK